MVYESIRYGVRHGVATITLDRPAARNAFTGTMGVELSDAYRRSAADDEVRVVVVAGTPPAFCAGADLRAGGDTFRSRPGSQFSAAATETAAWDVPKLVIAAVNGHALGIGLTLALQCDIRIFADSATYGVVQVRRGVMGDGATPPEDGGDYRRPARNTHILAEVFNNAITRVKRPGTALRGRPPMPMP